MCANFGVDGILNRLDLKAAIIRVHVRTWPQGVMRPIGAIDAAAESSVRSGYKSACLPDIAALVSSCTKGKARHAVLCG